MKFISKRSIFPLALLLVAFCSGGASGSENGGMEQGDTLDEADKFEYKFEDRPDPFLPFIRKDDTQITGTEDQIVDPERQLTGMQLFEPGQLKLVAVLSVGGRSIAMVEDVTGKGYRLDVGMPIGKHGVIHHIGNEEVKITETTKTQSGRINTREIVMRLKKEKEK